jgi:hypothetical protein
MIEKLNAHDKCIQCNAMRGRGMFFHEQIYEMNMIQLFVYIVVVNAKNQSWEGLNAY